MAAVGRSKPRRGGLWHSGTRRRRWALWRPLSDLCDAFDVDLGDIDDHDPFYDDDQPGDDDQPEHIDDDLDQLQRDVDEYFDRLDSAHGDDVVGGATRGRYVDHGAAWPGADAPSGGTTSDHVARDEMTATALAEFTIGAAFIGGTIVGAAMTLALLRIVRRQGR